MNSIIVYGKDDDIDVMNNSISLDDNPIVYIL